MLTEIDQALFKTNFWRRVDQTKLSSEQLAGKLVLTVTEPGA
ncbi:hypothetical protein [Oceanisphaera ostreae]|uniref:Uncharacterized protein n=1 Tax=Oceanisphaera ostreae TaxID=914151 RepID=A0ABW3KGD7_9GAMM